MSERIPHEWTEEEVRRLWPQIRRFMKLVMPLIEEAERDAANLMELDLQMETDE